MKTRTCGLLLAALSIATIGFTAEEIWQTNFEKAKAAAERDKKDLFVLFTGSDWCPPCMKLKDEVFSRPAFIEQAKKDFILVEVDFPREKSLSKEAVEQNKRLQETYEVQGYPIVVVMDWKARPYGMLGYVEGGLREFQIDLERVKKQKTARDEMISRAELLTGVARAKELDRVAKWLDGGNLLNNYDDLIQSVIDSDPKNEGGLNWEYRLLRVKMDTEKKKFPEALKKIDDLAKSQLTNDQKQELYMEKSSVFEAKNDRNGMIAALKEAIAVDPKSEMSKGIEEFIQKLQKFGVEKKE